MTIDRDAAGIWLAECPAIPGCVCRAATREETFAGIKNSIRSCLEVRAGRELVMRVDLLPFYMTAQRNGSKVTWSGEKEKIEALIRSGSELTAVNPSKSARVCLGRFRWNSGGFASRTVRLNTNCRKSYAEITGGTGSDSGHFRRA